MEVSSEPLLRVRGLAAGYGDIQVLWGVDLDVPRNSIVSIVGPNGAGKTTLLLTLSGMVSVRAGSWHFAGQDLTGLELLICETLFEKLLERFGYCVFRATGPIVVTFRTASRHSGS